jgi:AraC-like DNA-binding protein
MALPQVLRSLGADPAEILSEAGFGLKLFNDPQNQISFAARGRLLAHCVARTGCRHLGLLVGQQSGLHSLGLVGLLVKYSPDVGTALRNLVRYFYLTVRGPMVTLAAEGGSAIFGYHIHQPHVEATDQVGDASVAAMFNIMRGLCGPDFKPAEAWFAHSKPEDVEPFRRFLKVHLRFDAEHYALVFSASWLDRALTEADRELQHLLQRQIATLEAQHGDDLRQQVRSILRTAVPAGRSKADQIASLFSMHSRTLNRHLNALGTSYQDLLDEIRYEIARQVLEDSSMDVSELAAFLDYAGARSFIRAFRRWSDTTPAHWRTTKVAAKARAVAARSAPRVTLRSS